MTTTIGTLTLLAATWATTGVMWAVARRRPRLAARIDRWLLGPDPDARTAREEWLG